MAKILSILSTLACHFHNSAVRTRNLKEAAEENNLTLLAMPKLFNVRWTEFTHKLLHAVLVNWKAIVLYFQQNPDPKGVGAEFLKCLLNLDFMKIVAFLADVLFVFQRMQKKLQGDKLTLMTMQASVKSAISSLESLKEILIPGGKESAFIEGLTDRNEKIFLKEIELSKESYFRQSQWSDVSKLRADVLMCLQHFLKTRLQLEDEELLSTIEPFANLQPSTDLTKVHAIFAQDLNLSSIYLQYNDLIANLDRKTKPSVQEILEYLVSSERQVHFQELAIVFSRIIALTPNSADVERCVSSNNLLKTTLRNSFKVENENKYLFVHFNLPELQNWNPRPAIVEWIKKCDRRQRDVSTTSGKAVQQHYFKGVFAKVVLEENSGSESDSEQIA